MANGDGPFTIFGESDEMKILSLLILIFLVGGCSSGSETQRGEAVLTGLNGKTYLTPDWPEKTKAKLDSQLVVAQENFDDDPSEENYIWLGRREAYLYQYKKAIQIFSDGINKFPQSYKLFRHRGHRYITVRDFNRAVADLQQAAALMPRQPLEIEPDGQPNKQNIPLSSTQFNVWYHLGLAHYLKQDFNGALKAYDQCMKVSVNDDLLCATTDWMYMTLMKAGMKEDAGKLLERISPEMNIIENDSYHKRLLMYKGLLPSDSVLNVNVNNEDADLAIATQGYGVGNWYLSQGDTVKAKQIFERVLSGKHFAAFGFIAAEVELQQLNKQPK
jgi:tetratricopeptide (TPR) repeat protein